MRITAHGFHSIFAINMGFILSPRFVSIVYMENFVRSIVLLTILEDSTILYIFNGDNCMQLVLSCLCTLYFNKSYYKWYPVLDGKLAGVHPARKTMVTF